MADKKIEIRMAVTGGDQAAVQIRAVGDALGSETGSGGGLAAGGKAAVKQLDELSIAAPRAAGASNNMRFAVQNAAFQFQDMAVQAEMGTSAVRIFSQQVPQLLGSFGAVGAIAGAVIGVGVPLAAALFRGGDEAEKAKPKIDELKDILAEYAKEAQKVADAKRVADLGDWFSKLDEEEKYYERINDKLARQVAFQTKLAALKSASESAEREARIAEIEADPTLTREQQIQQVAAIREEDAAAKAAEEKAKLQRDAEAKAEAAKAADEALRRQQEDLESARKERERLEVEEKATRQRYGKANIAGISVPKLEEQLGKAVTNFQNLKSRDIEFGVEMQSTKDAENEVNRLKADLETAKTEASKLDIYRKKKETAEKMAEAARKGESEQAAQTPALEASRESTFGESVNATAVAEQGTQAIDSRYEAERRARQARTDMLLRAEAEKRRQEQEREEEKKKREEERKQREAEQRQNAEQRLAGTQRDIETDITGLGQEAMQAARGMGDPKAEGFNTLARKIARKGDSQGDQAALARMLERLGKLVDAIPDTQSGSEAAQKLREVERKMERKMEQMQSQIKNLRPPNK